MNTNQICEIFNLTQKQVFMRLTQSSLLYLIFMCLATIFWIGSTIPANSTSHTFIEIDYGDSNQSDKTFYIRNNTTSIPTFSGTVRYTGSLFRFVLKSQIDNRPVQTHYNTSVYGHFHFELVNSNCPGGAHYKCAPTRYTPNFTQISNSLPLGSTLKIFVTVNQNNRNEYQGNLDRFTFYIKREDIEMNWKNYTESTINSDHDPDSVGVHRIDIIGYYINESELGFELWITDGFDEVSKHTLTRGTYTDVTTFAAWYFESSYGTWLVSESNFCSSATDGRRCLRAYYEPNSIATNLRGKNVTMEFRGTKTLGNQSQTEYLKFKIIGEPLSSLEWTIADSGTIVTGNQLEFNDISGTATIFKKKANAYSVDVTERVNNFTQTFDESGGDSLIFNDFQAYPLGDNLFKYGYWLVEETFSGESDPNDNLFESGTLRLAFKPNTVAINNPLNTDETITSKLSLKLREGNSTSQVIQTSTITVTIDRSSVKPILSITSESSSVVEGQTATFIITSNVNPMQPFYVSYIPTNSVGDFLDSTTFPSGLPQFKYLIFSQSEGSEDWTDEIEINLRETDGVDTENGSITVTLNTASDYAFYFAAAEPANSITIMIEDAEKPTLNFAESSYTVAEADADKNMQLTLTISESIGDTISVSYTIVNESATGGVDFVDIANGSVTILPNTTSIPIIIQIKGDDVSEGDETFKVIISDPPTNAYFSRGVSELNASITIFDDEPILLSAATTNFNVPEDVVDGNFVIDLQLTSAVAHTNSVTTSVSYETTVSSGTAALGEDFMSPVINRRTININSITDSQLIPILNDTDNEGNETFSVTISNLTGANFASGGTELTLDITIIDNEKPELSFAEDSYSITEENADTNVELTFNLSAPIENPIEISYETIEDTATADVDFTNISNGTATITASSTSVSISIQIKGDTLNEGNETFMVNVATPPTNAVFADGNSELVATITIIDDEVPTLSVDNSTLSVSESAGTTKIGLILSGPTSDDVVVTYSTSITDLNTAQPADFTAQSASTQTITSDASSRLIQIPINNDTDTEEEETFTLTLSQVTGAAFLGGTNITVIVTIVDDERLPTLSINSTRINVNEQAGYAEIGLSFTPATTEPVMVTYTTIQNTAFDDMDYVMQTSETIEIPSGPTGTIYIPITNDNIFEGNENFSVIITGISGAAYESDVINEPIIITIVDNEVEPTLTISNLTCEYGEPITTGVTVGESDENLIFNAKLSHPSKNPVSFKFASSIDFSLSPFASSDDFYVNDARQVTIQPGSICTEVITPITYDELGEEDEKFWVEFTDNSDMEIIPRILVTIVDDDVVYWSIDDLAMDEGDVNTGMFFNVSLNTPRPFDLGTISADWTVTSESGDTATFREDYAPRHNLHTGMVSIFGGRTQSLIGEHDPRNRIETVGDTIYEPNETFTVTLSNPEGDTYIGDGIAIATLINDDPKPTLTVSADASVSETDENLAITATLSNQTTEDITLRYSTTNGTAIGGLDFITQSNVLHTIPALATTSTINIPIMNDEIFESVETFTVTLSSLTNATFPYLADEIEISVLINESLERPVISFGNSNQPEISFINSFPAVNESSRTATITANLSHASTEIISVQFSTSDGTATSSGANPDFIALTNQPFIFSPGETSKDIIPITINQDSINEGNETFSLTLSQANNVSFADSTTSLNTKVTIVDDDSPTLSFKTTNFNVRF